MTEHELNHEDVTPEPEAPTSADAPMDEGDIAADFIEELLDILDLDGDIDITEHGDRVEIVVGSADDAELAPLARPEVVEALQELTRLAVQTKTGGFARLVLDVAGSRAAREGELQALVERAAETIASGADRAFLPAMSSYERKIVHDLVAERGLTSESEGEGRDRRVVVVPA